MNQILKSTGTTLALWAARAMGLEEQKGIKLIASDSCLYKEVGEGAVPFAFRPDSNLTDAVPLIAEMSKAGTLTLTNNGAQFESPEYGHVGFSDVSTPTAICRCYIAWKMSLKAPVD